MERSSMEETASKQPASEKSLVGKGIQYLFATINSADWIDDSYKRFAEKYRNEEKPLKELYLCFCDKVPLELLIAAEQKEPVEFSFRLCRRKHIESEILKEHSNELEEIKHITAGMEAEVKSMSGTVSYIAAAIPTLDDLFQSDEMPEGGSVSDESISIKANMQETEIERNERGGKKEHKEESQVLCKEKTEFHCIGRLIKCIKMKLSEIVSLHQKEPARFVIELYAENYKEEQINFIMDCMEKGMKVSEIEKFADPKISVDMMKRLSRMQNNIRKEEK